MTEKETIEKETTEKKISELPKERGPSFPKEMLIKKD